jgi:4-hydroxy-tetrahydrodipicolinate synthase
LTLAMHAAFARGDWSEGMRLQRLIAPIEVYRARDASSYNISMLKYAMTRVGKDFGPPRPPQRHLTPDECREIDRLLAPILDAESNMADSRASR